MFPLGSVFPLEPNPSLIRVVFGNAGSNFTLKYKNISVILGTTKLFGDPSIVILFTPLHSNFNKVLPVLLKLGVLVTMGAGKFGKPASTQYQLTQFAVGEFIA